MSRWQDDKQVIVWPDELAPGTLRFTIQRWNQR
jgi:hypothetical protein